MNTIINILKSLIFKPADNAGDLFMRQLVSARRLHALVADCLPAQTLVKAAMVEIVEHAHDGHNDAAS